MKIKQIQRGAWLFLSIPYILFLIGWLKPIFAIPLTGAIIAALVHLFRQLRGDERLISKDAVITVAITSVVIFMSGISGHAFQNWDFHGRNAVFHDLINYPWPVVYDPTSSSGSTLLLSYYMAYWLPSALVGKLLGWEIANIALFLWSVFGVFFILALLSVRLKTSMLNIALLFFSFSGMDILGIGVNRLLVRSLYPGLWPPVQHLEWWSSPVEISAILTQLYWVFNQAVPVLLAMSLWLTGIKKEHTIFLWALTFFFSPLPAIGLIFFFGVGLLLRESPQQDAYSYLRQLKNSFSASDLLGMLIFLMGFAYFSTNLIAQDKGLQLWDPFLHIIFFSWKAVFCGLFCFRNEHGIHFGWSQV